jgi:hypothetical protein
MISSDTTTTNKKIEVLEKRKKKEIATKAIICKNKNKIRFHHH